MDKKHKLQREQEEQERKNRIYLDDVRFFEREDVKEVAQAKWDPDLKMFYVMTVEQKILWDKYKNPAKYRKLEQPLKFVHKHILGGKYYVSEHIGRGSFGDVFAVSRISDKKNFAAKIERFRERSKLLNELKLMEHLKDCKYVPNSIDFGVHEISDSEKYNILIMDLLGPSLNNVFDPDVQIDSS